MHSARFICIAIALLPSACSSRSDWSVDQLQLPGGSYFPESLTAAADGSLYVGSLGTGQVVRFQAGDNIAHVVVAPSSDRNIAGVLVDDDDASVLTCTGSIASFGVGNYVGRFAIADGSLRARYPLPDGSFCNDLAFDGAHNLFLTDSIGGRIFTLPRGAADGTPPTMWATDASLRGPTAADLGADGIAFDGKGGFYVNNVTTGALVRIAVAANGSAGEILQIAVSPPLNGPDGMRALDAKTLVVAEGPANRVSAVRVDGAVATRVDLRQLKEPSSVAVVGHDAWSAEGQILRLVSNPQVEPDLPFWVRRIGLP